ncbi:MAG TPA: peptidase U32 [Ruminococcaceae bacterium]|nr:peptidase U32 [Oscillospiraceae bacterium]
MFRESSAEILAPAGTYEAVEAAVRCGADAVYLGGRELNARRNASNFNGEEMKKAVAYCHAHGVKVHMTLNTLASDEELADAAQRAIRQACQAGVDALIVQDLGVFRLVKSCAPTMPIHASTQMSVHTLAGVKKLAELGFTRAVLSRELSLTEIEAIAAHAPIELEVFIHGALCMSVSGQCLMSAMLGSRSANRGLCAQPCRLPFAAPGGTGNDLSLKDLSATEYIARLSQAGVCSFKIEGRMKRPEYVAAAVTACRKARDGETDPVLQEQLRSVFSRSGFTKGYLDGALGRDMFGTRRKEDVTAAQPVLKELHHLYEKETPRVGVEMMFCAYEGETASLSVKANGKTVFVQGDTEAVKAEKVPLTKEKIENQLRKCGGTPFEVTVLDLDIDENISLPLSSINALRRQALEALYAEIEQTKMHTFSPLNVKNTVKKVNKTAVFARFSTISQVENLSTDVKNFILPLAQAQPMNGKNVIAELPTVFFGREEKVREQILSAKEKGITCLCAATLDGVALAQECGMDFMLGLGSNVFNTLSILHAEDLGAKAVILSPEMTLRQVADLGGEIGRGLITYGRLPLMTTRNCPIKNGTDCAKCGRSRSLTDRLGISFPVRCFDGYSQVFNSRPIYLADRKKETDMTDFAVLYFTTETAEECAEVLEQYRTEAPAQGEFTRGLYYRGVE